MATLATLVIEVDTDTSDAIAGINRLDSEVGGGLGSMAKTVGKGVAVGAGIAAAGLATMGTIAVKSAIEAEKVTAQTQAVLESTGGAANVTATEIADLASEIQGYSGMSDEAVQSGQNLLLTFTNIRNEAGKGNDIFNQTTTIMADMSTALGQDTSASAIQLGKALNDPIKGVTALSKVGVSFTEQTREQIAALVESGQTMEAQKIILAELTTEFGGSAKAIGETAGGQFQILQETVGNAMEEVGGSLLEIGESVLPILSGAFTDIVKAVGPALETLLQALAPVVAELVDALAPVLPDIAQALGDVLIALVPLIPPLGRLLAAIVPLIPLLVNLVVTAIEPLITVLATVIDWVAKVVDAFVRWVEKTEILKTIGEVIGGVVQTVIDLVTGLVSIVRDVAERLGGVWDRIRDAAVAAWRWISDKVGPIIDGIMGFIDDLIGAIQKAIDWLRQLGNFGAGLGADLAGLIEGGQIVIPGLAHGGLVTRGGMAMVGERGPELLRLPAGAEVSPRITGGMPGGGGAVAVVNNGTMIGLSPADLAQLIRREILKTGQRNVNTGL